MEVGSPVHLYSLCLKRQHIDLSGGDSVANEEKLLNPNCLSSVLLSHIKKTCGFSDLPEPIDLASETGEVVDLVSKPKEYAKRFLEQRTSYILVKVIGEETEESTPTYISLLDNPEKPIKFAVLNPTQRQKNKSKAASRAAASLAAAGAAEGTSPSKGGFPNGPGSLSGALGSNASDNEKGGSGLSVGPGGGGGAGGLLGVKGGRMGGGSTTSLDEAGSPAGAGMGGKKKAGNAAGGKAGGNAAAAKTKKKKVGVDRLWNNVASADKGDQQKGDGNLCNMALTNGQAYFIASIIFACIGACLSIFNFHKTHTLLKKVKLPSLTSHFISELKKLKWCLTKQTWLILALVVLTISLILTVVHMAVFKVDYPQGSVSIVAATISIVSVARLLRAARAKDALEKETLEKEEALRESAKGGGAAVVNAGLGGENGPRRRSSRNSKDAKDQNEDVDENSKSTTGKTAVAAYTASKFFKPNYQPPVNSTVAVSTNLNNLESGLTSSNATNQSGWRSSLPSFLGGKPQKEHRVDENSKSTIGKTAVAGYSLFQMFRGVENAVERHQQHQGELHQQQQESSATLETGANGGSGGGAASGAAGGAAGVGAAAGGVSLSRNLYTHPSADTIDPTNYELQVEPLSSPFGTSTPGGFGTAGGLGGAIGGAVGTVVGVAISVAAVTLLSGVTSTVLAVSDFWAPNGTAAQVIGGGGGGGGVGGSGNSGFATSSLSVPGFTTGTQTTTLRSVGVTSTLPTSTVVPALPVLDATTSVFLSEVVPFDGDSSHDNYYHPYHDYHNNCPYHHYYYNCSDHHNNCPYHHYYYNCSDHHNNCPYHLYYYNCSDHHNDDNYYSYFYNDDYNSYNVYDYHNHDNNNYNYHNNNNNHDNNDNNHDNHNNNHHRRAFANTNLTSQPLLHPPPM
ncbi:hypothetical protein HDV05_006095 [Chytridiales sp. JEL 0842]|nr:hypothetical protein HDV05_006095 [Chytridiales sp. JEL 0842]